MRRDWLRWKLCWRKRAAERWPARRAAGEGGPRGETPVVERGREASARAEPPAHFPREWLLRILWRQVCQARPRWPRPAASRKPQNPATQVRVPRKKARRRQKSLQLLLRLRRTIQLRQKLHTQLGWQRPRQFPRQPPTSGLHRKFHRDN